MWRPSTRIWYVLQSSGGQVKATQWGDSTDEPVKSMYCAIDVKEDGAFQPRLFFFGNPVYVDSSVFNLPETDGNSAGLPKLGH